MKTTDLAGGMQVWHARGAGRRGGRAEDALSMVLRYLPQWDAVGVGQPEVGEDVAAADFDLDAMPFSHDSRPLSTHQDAL